MNNYDKSTESSYLMYLDANNLYEWEMSQKLPVNGFKWAEKLSKSHNENSDMGYFLEVNVKYLKRLFNLHQDVSFLPERKKLEKTEKIVCGIEDKKICSSPKSLIRSTKSWINTKKSTQSNSI